MWNDNDPVVVSGMGTVSVFGTDHNQFWDHLLGESDSKSTSSISNDFLDLPVIETIRVNHWNPEDLIGKRGLKYLSLSTQYLFSAAVRCWQDAGLGDISPVSESESLDLGVVVGSNLAGLQAMSDYDYITVTQGPRSVSPMQAPNTIANAPAAQLAIRTNARAFNTTIATGQCAGLDAIAYAVSSIHKGRAKQVLVGGVEEINERVLWIYQHSNVLPKEYSDRAGKPFSSDSTGCIPGEGASVILLERLSDCLKRGGTPLGKIISYSNTVAMDEDSRIYAMESAVGQVIKQAGIDFSETSGIISGASGFYAQDAVEMKAIRHLFGTMNPEMPISSIKGAIGETYGASGVFQAAAGLLALNKGILPKSMALSELNHRAQEKIPVHLAANHLKKTKKQNIVVTSQDLSGITNCLMLESV
ncbi:beta-ketoacyl-[acyl-carrier-protein] synthase family protein [Paenibacillus medicaginis]|uniref:Beta-ketoacyl-[acyl-carrier-protein] synthase family protein n=1 Tax=Paenibacillus medicaginis TaxID=1470560 RepID=A0ABV5BYS5_9BACL